jgi:nicotinamidase-related amidase
MMGGNTMPRTALLVIDVQRGAFDGVRCEPITDAQRLVDHSVALIHAAREAAVPIVFIQHCAEPGDAFEEGSPHGELHEALQPLSGDKVLKKHASSAFQGTDLAGLLDGLGAERLVVCGLQSEFCVFNTSRSALDKGFALTVAEDGHTTWPSKTETANAISARINEDLQKRGAELRSTADIARSWREAKA